MEDSKNQEVMFFHIESLIKRVNQLRNNYLELIDENRFLKIKLEEKERELENQKNYIKNLENELKNRNLATHSGISESQQLYINELLKEIDACLSLLENT